MSYRLSRPHYEQIAKNLRLHRQDLLAALPEHEALVTQQCNILVTSFVLWLTNDNPRNFDEERFRHDCGQKQEKRPRV